MTEPFYESNGPSIKEIIDLIYKYKNKDHIQREIISIVVNDYYKEIKPGSYRGYYTYDHLKLLKLVKSRSPTVRLRILRRKLYVYTKAVGYLILYWRECMEKRYRPHGKGYEEASASFKTMKI